MGRRPQLNCIRADLQIAFVLPVGLAIGKYVHNLLQSGLRFAQTVLLGQAFPALPRQKVQGLASLHPLACSSLADLASSLGLE